MLCKLGHHIRLIEGVQRRFTRMIPELKSLTYEARLKRLNLTTLEIRRIRGDLIEVYRILNGLEKINPDSLFTRSRYTNIRCHTMKLEKKQVHLDIRKYFFTQRVIDYWNALPVSCQCRKYEPIQRSTEYTPVQYH